MNGEIKKETWSQKIAEAIIEGRTFDITENQDGFTTVTEMIAKKMCDGLSLAQVIEFHPRYHEMVKKNLGHATKYIQNEMNVPVYKSISPGGKFIEYLTIDPDYRDAKNDEINRIGGIISRCLSSQKEQFEIISPRRDFGHLVHRQLNLLN